MDASEARRMSQLKIVWSHQSYRMWTGSTLTRVSHSEEWSFIIYDDDTSRTMRRWTNTFKCTLTQFDCVAQCRRSDCEGDQATEKEFMSSFWIVAASSTYLQLEIKKFVGRENWRVHRYEYKSCYCENPLYTYDWKYTFDEQFVKRVTVFRSERLCCLHPLL